VPIPNEEHDERASREAERRMTLRDVAGADDQGGSQKKAGGSSKMDGEHDPEALEVASERMLLRRDRA
jgi:hypothetical protein